MRHKNRGRKLGHGSAHRKALCLSILRSLFTHGKIITTVSKAKEYAPMAEKMISIAKKAETKIEAMKTKMLADQEMTPAMELAIAQQSDAIRVAQFRFALSKLRDRALVQKLFYHIAPLFSKREGGYTRITRLSKARLGDNAPQALLSLVEPLPAQSDIAKKAEELTKKAKKHKEDLKTLKAKVAKS